jgi:hypothetical protein
MRTEHEVFAELGTLCKSKGYVHALAFICFKDGMVPYAGEMTTESLRGVFSKDRLIRTEVSTLTGLLIKAEVDYSIPSPKVLQDYINRTYALLEELHQSMLLLQKSALAELAGEGDRQELIARAKHLLNSGEAMREPIFYGGESAYSFQYREFSVNKYAHDNGWLQENKGFTIQVARDVVHAVTKLQDNRLTIWVNSLLGVSPDKWTILQGFTFTATEVSNLSGIDKTLIEKVLTAFAVAGPERNEGFRSVHDFNVVNATPLLRKDEEHFILFQQYSLLEALYEAPFYWTVSDHTYAAIAMEHRGSFTEQFAAERLRAIFGNTRVHKNVEIYRSKTTRSARLGEIDVLVLFGDRAIVLQSKSKRLTLEARRGNDRQIKDDFKKSVQDAYDQAFQCAQLLNDFECTFFDSAGKSISVPRQLKEIYLFCMVADSYPALSFQVKHFLKVRSGENIKAPFVMDVFTLDAMAEMLQSPLHFLSYCNKRTGYSEKLLAGHELIILSYHLKRNLWLDDKYDFVTLEDDFSADLDVAMSARRDGVPGKRTPDGILTRVANTTLGGIVREIEFSADPQVLDLGFMLLTLAENAYIGISKAIDTVTALSRKDGKHHDCTAGLDECATGLTVHSNTDPIPIAAQRLERHCAKRKYAHKKDRWFGICVEPQGAHLRFGMNLDFKWEQNDKMDELTRDVDMSAKGGEMRFAKKAKNKIGRNSPCPCGSQKKYKRCHGAN